MSENVLTNAEIKRRGLAAIEELLPAGPVHLVKRNRRTAVILSEADYRRLIEASRVSIPGLGAAEWLLAQPASGVRGKEEIDSALSAERNW